MSPLWAAVSLAAALVVPVALLSLWSFVRFVRRFRTFRCRIGPPARRRRARWWRFRRRAAWAGGVLLVRSGPIGAWVTPLATGVPAEVVVRPLDALAARGLGPRPVVLRMRGTSGAELEVAAAASSAALLVGPYLLAAMAQLPPAPRERGC